MFEWLPGCASRSHGIASRRIAPDFLAPALVLSASLDIISTNAGLRIGGIKANNLVRLLRKWFGRRQFLPRLTPQS